MMTPLLEATYTLTSIMLLTTASITFVEALRTPTPFVRHVLNLETAISLIAGYFYSLMLAKKGESVTNLRYMDWSMTTPLMLITLCLVLGSATNVPIRFPVIALIIALNYAMLYAGYLGDTGALSRPVAMLLGFLPFLVMFYIVYKVFVSTKYVLSNFVLFGVYLSVWSMYGLVYLLEEDWKNMATNLLDAVAKCCVGIGLFFFYSKIIVW